MRAARFAPTAELLTRLRLLLVVAGVAWVFGLMPGAMLRAGLVVLVVGVLLVDAVVETHRVVERQTRRFTIPAQRTESRAVARTGGVR